MSSQKKKKVLIVAHDARATGGVNNFLRIMRRKIRHDTHALRFANGRRHGETGKLKGATRMLRDYIRFCGHIAGRGYDVVHVNPSFDKASLPRELVFILLAKIVSPRSKTLLFFRGWDWNAFRYFESNKLAGGYLALATRLSDRILVLSSEFREALVRTGVAPEKIFLATTMFEGDAIKAAADPALVRNPRQVVFLSRFLPAKGGAELIEATAALAKSYPDIRLIMAGDGPSRAEWQALTDRLGANEQVEFTGYIHGAQKMRFLAESAIFALPTTHPEGLPNAILEAMASGCVIVSTPVAGIPDVVADGDNGTLIQAQTSEMIEGAIRKYFEDTSRTQAISAQNTKKAWNTWESAIVSQRISDHYSQMVSGDAR